VDDATLSSVTVARDQLELVVGPDHEWARIERVDPRELPQTEWVMREPGSGTRSEFEAALGGFGLSPQALRVVLELPSNEAVRAAVEAGMGAAVISASVVAGSLEAGLLHRVRLDLSERIFARPAPSRAPSEPRRRSSADADPRRRNASLVSC
jgi:DNA-binding transcriptional LysR family regulator